MRHCFSSNISKHKKRLPGFSSEKCFENLLQTSDLKKVNLTFFLDIAHRKKTHFLERQHKFPLVTFEAGSEAVSFLKMIDHVTGKSFPKETIIYFLEEDYLHREGWTEILREGLTLPNVDYVTLFDHRDKYLFPEYKTLCSKIFHTKSCHWRTTPSTTNTYAMRFGTLQRHLDVHRCFSMNRKISADHEKFLKLGEVGACLISSIPGFSTHVESEFLSPTHNWEKYFKESPISV